MEDAVLVLVMLFILVMSSFMLDRYACMVISQSGFALLFGLLIGGLLVLMGKDKLMHSHLKLDNNLFFNVLLPPIIYEGGFSIKRQAFFRNFPAIMSTAILGTVIATVVTGGAVYLSGKYGVTPELSWVEAFLFGALISAVDPVATLACFNKLNAPPLLFNLVFGESVLNDAVAIALYQTLMKWKPDSGFTAHEVLAVCANTMGMFVGSLLVSMAITLSGAFLLKRQVFDTLRYFPTYEISLCLIFSLLTYFVADWLHLSGIVALFFSGTMTAHYHFHTISREAQHSFTHLLHTLAFICENFVYLFMGTSVVFMFTGQRDAHGLTLHVSDLNWTFIGITMVACLVGRFCNIFPLLSISNCFRSKSDLVSCKYMTIIWFAGLRGSIAFALAKSWSYVGLHGNTHKKLVESTTMMVVLVTTVVIGGLTGPFLALLGLAHKTPPVPQEHPSTTSSNASSDPGSVSANSSGELVPHRRPQHQMRMSGRGSMHFMVHPGSMEHARHSMTEGSRAEEVDADAVFTPRPQFRDNSDEDEAADIWDDLRAPTLHGQVATLPRASSALRRESYTGALFRRWQDFDARYLQPVFGGYTQADHAGTIRRSVPFQSGIDPVELAKLRQEHAGIL